MIRAAVALVLGLVLAAAALAAPSRPKPALATTCGLLSDFEPAWSPSGRALLFTRQREYGAVSSVYRIGVDGRHEQRVTPLGDYAYGAAWSADGSRIAYATFDLAAVVHIVVARADGNGAAEVASFQGMREPPTTFLTWSRSGDLAFVDFNDDLRTPQRLIAHGATQPAWSPDGRRIAYVGTQGIIVADADGGDAHEIAQGSQPTWSPDGTRIAYVGGRGGIHVIGSDGGGDRLVDASATSPRWTADGWHVVDVLRVDAGTARSTIRVANISTGHVRTLTHDASLLYGSDDFQPAAAPSGATIAFAAEPTFGGTELRYVRTNGRGERRLTYHCVRPNESAGTHVVGTWLPDVINTRNRFRDNVACGAGFDVVYVDRRDRVGRGCERVRRG